MPFKWTRPPDAIKRTVRSAKKRFDERMLMSMYVEWSVELTEMQRRTPVWNPERKAPSGHTPGSLRASGRLEGPTYEKGQYEIAVLFGGPMAPYAFYVHEDVDAKHASGEAKFVESVMRESKPYMNARIARRAQL